MNREIKFRAFDKVDGTMYYNNPIIRGYDVLNPSDDMVVMQYTGLEDMNGIPVYEGAIIFNTDRKEFAVICYSEEQAMFVAKYVITKDEYPASVSISNLYCCVGNIYQHPHLLNREQSVEVSDTSKAK